MVSLRLMAKLLCVGALGALTACGFARVPYNAGGQSSAQSAPCSPSTGVAGQVRVCAGDTLIGLAHRHDVTVLGLVRENGLTDNQIFAGQILTLPNERVYVVQPGDQLLSIAERYGVSSGDIVAANDLNWPYTLYPQQRLAIPQGPANQQVATNRRPEDSLPESPPVTNRPPSGPMIIGSGAPAAGQPTNPATRPPVAQPEHSAVAQAEPKSEQPTAGEPKLSEPKPEAEPAAGSNVAAASAAPPLPRDRPQEPVQAPSVAKKEPEPTKPDTSKSSKPAAKAEAVFLLPVQGRIISDFGPKSGGLHNDGINIAAPRGTPILATADGEIAYAGDGLPGFGNLILIRHADGWTSAYAHADSMAVKRGDKVERGQEIGRVGSTGSVNEPQLHFELRKQDKAVDPTSLLGT